MSASSLHRESTDSLICIILCISYNTPSSDMARIYQPYLEEGVL